MKNERKKSAIGKTIGPILIAVLLIIAAGGIFLVQKFMPSKERVSPEDYFGVMAEDEVAITLNEELTTEYGLLRDARLYLPYDLVRRELNSRFFWDESNGQMLFTTALETYEIPVNSTSYTIDGAEHSYECPIVLQEDMLYLSADYLMQYTPIECVLCQEPNHVRIRSNWGEQSVARVKKDTVVRLRGGIKSPILTDVAKDAEVTVLEELQDWAWVVTEDGYIGYVKKLHLDEIETRDVQMTREYEPQEYSSLTEERKIKLVWHMSNSQEANAYLSTDIANMTGMNVISPTWYSVADNEGAIDSVSSQEYVKTAHEAGLEVWALISNFSADVDTTTLLSSTQARRRMIDTLVKDALALGIEGINLDFEYIREECGYSYVQFVRELSIACRKNHLIFSVDVPVPMEFNRYFDRKELGTVADYVIIMGYDEHYPGSDPGSVASLGYEENGITGTLAQSVPKEKILSGIPTYTRIWYSASDADGNTVVNSEEISMSAVENTLDSYHVTPSWDESVSQNYAAWKTDEDVLCEIWIEDAESLAKKVRLVGQYELGGFAVWALGYEKAEIWDVLTTNMQE